ncbi:superoxide dismutase [candidate division GN15 bacterium]|uniref:Superoxide dismutase n=1 Tax=candidate division GN15 bacterium TaxID=2072418 RepID=A0A855X7G6_9BACT|nr:MAG: superoxide dismutase [candidate division GN15 bacterium]
MMADHFKVKPLPYAYDKLDGISKQTNTYHHDTHYAGYVKKRNEILDKLAAVDRSLANANYSEFGGMKRHETFNAGGQLLHELFWDVLGGDGKPTGEVLRHIEKSFGSFEKWVEDFRASAMVALGWVVLAWDPTDDNLYNFTGDAHNQGGVWGTFPLLAIDVYEHAYYHDQGPARAKYIEAYLKNINWSEVNRRYRIFSKITGEFRASC